MDAFPHAEFTRLSKAVHALNQQLILDEMDWWANHDCALVSMISKDAGQPLEEESGECASRPQRRTPPPPNTHGN